MNKNNSNKFFQNRKLQKQSEFNKQEVVSVTYEEIGLFPRSFSRVTDRFLQQIFSEVDNLIIHEYRFYRYLFFTTFKSLLILFCVPLLVNFLAKNYFVRPITEYLWNSKQTEIFLNTYQQKQAFLELKDFEEKLYFESLIDPPPLPIYRKDTKFVQEGKINPSSLEFFNHSEFNIYQNYSSTEFLPFNKKKNTMNIFANDNILNQKKPMRYDQKINSFKFSDSKFVSREARLNTKLKKIQIGQKITSVLFKNLDPIVNLSDSSIYLKKKKLTFNNLNLKKPNVLLKVKNYNTKDNKNLGFSQKKREPRFFKEIVNINSANDMFYVKFNRPTLITKTKSMSLTLQEKTIELAARYNLLSIEAITNFCSDLISFFTLCYLLFALEIQVNITKSFLLEVFFGLDDSKKSLLILLITDLLVGYHSSNIWELFFEFIFDHYGFAESQTGVFLLVATLPVLLDVLFKYLIFRHLNRSSPATVATYHAMIE